MKRSGFKLRAFDPTAKLAVKIKPRTCKNRACRNKFTPDEKHPFMIACCEGCKIILAKQHIQKAEAARARKEARELKARKEAAKTIRDLIAEAQVVFNAWVRERDRLAGHPCISSGRPLDWSGNNVDAGHYRSRGSADHLRFNEDNCHAQSKQDNRYGSGNAVDYRIGLIKRIGLARVEALEADQTVVKWTREMLIAIKTEYKRKLKELQAREATC